jgi:hypothetical protein
MYRQPKPLVCLPLPVKQGEALFQLLTNGNMLRAVLFAFAAFDAGVCLLALHPL